MKRLFLVVSLLTFSTFSNAEFYSGNDLKQMCAAPSYTDDAICMGYVTGVYDTLLSQGAICSSGGVTVGQLQEIVKKYFSQNPERLHFTAQSLVRSSFRAAFPCSRR
jgi:hypothetical protein